MATRAVPTAPAGILVAPLGDVAQLAEHRLCKAGVEGSSPFVSTHTTADPAGLHTKGAGAGDLLESMGDCINVVVE